MGKCLGNWKTTLENEVTTIFAIPLDKSDGVALLR